MIIPDKVKKRKITISDTINDPQDKIVEADIKFSNKRLTLLVGPDLLIRFEYKKPEYNKRLNILQRKIMKDEKIFNSDKKKNLQKILISDREIRELINKDKKEMIRREESVSDDFLDNLKRRTENLKKFTKKMKFKIIRQYNEYYCKICKGFRSGPDLTQSKSAIPICGRCSSQLQKFSIDKIDTDITAYLGGYWFEDYIANILNEAGWKAWASPSLLVYGVSGAPHQIDVLAIKNGRILIIECKTHEFTPLQVRNFLGKYFDIRCHQSLAISIENIHPDGIKIIEKNPAIRYYSSITNFKKLKSYLFKI